MAQCYEHYVFQLLYSRLHVKMSCSKFACCKGKCYAILFAKINPICGLQPLIDVWFFVFPVSGAKNQVGFYSALNGSWVPQRQNAMGPQPR